VIGTDKADADDVTSKDPRGAIRQLKGFPWGVPEGVMFERIDRNLRHGYTPQQTVNMIHEDLATGEDPLDYDSDSDDAPPAATPQKKKNKTKKKQKKPHSNKPAPPLHFPPINLRAVTPG
jgi:hypothetical protein